MKVLTVFLTLFVWTEARSAHSSKPQSDEKNDEEGEPLNEMDFYNATFINITKHHLRTYEDEENDDDPLLRADLFEGDIDMGNSSDIASFQRNAIRKPASRWPNAIVPYTISNAFDSEARTLIAKVITEYHMRTCIRFVPKTSAHKHYINIVQGNGCYSSVGYNRRAQDVSLGKGCHQFGSIAHELMHTLGFWHEQSRPDRDDYVKIEWDNVKKGMESQFKKHTWEHADVLNETYDFDSLMHYYSTAYSKNSSESTIIPKEAKEKSKTMGLRDDFSPGDLRKINKRYQCNGTKEEKVNGSECADRDGRCAEWAKQGQCEKNNSAWIRPNCMNSCGICDFSKGCKDLSEKCPEWSKKSQCDDNSEFMKIFCIKSCGVCTS